MWTLLTCACACALLAGSAAQPKLSPEELQEILENPRAVQAYIACILDKGPCTAEGRELRERIPIGLKTSCGDCSADQKQTVRTAVRYIQQHYPEEWQQLHEHFDPQGEYVDSFQHFIDSDD